MRQYTFKTRLVAALLSGVVLCGTPAYIMAEDEDLTNQLDSIQQQVNQQNAAKADAETVIEAFLNSCDKLKNNFVKRLLS